MSEKEPKTGVTDSKGNIQDYEKLDIPREDFDRAHIAGEVVIDSSATRANEEDN